MHRNSFSQFPYETVAIATQCLIFSICGKKIDNSFFIHNQQILCYVQQQIFEMLFFATGTSQMAVFVAGEAEGKRQYAGERVCNKKFGNSRVHNVVRN